MSNTTSHVHVLTANRLADGVVVFLGPDGAWVPGLAGAAIARSEDEARCLEAQGARDAALNQVVEPYLVELRETAAGLLPIRQRERVRVAGPSMLADVPGYVAPAPSSSAPPPLRPELVEGRSADGTLVVRQAHHEVSHDGVLRPEPVEGRPATHRAEAA